MTSSNNGSSDRLQEIEQAEFGLVPPSGELARVTDRDRPAPKYSGPSMDRSKPSTEESGGYKSMGWKGLEEDQGDGGEPPVTFAATFNDPKADEIDMTPMVDVVFLLLIFFMVTASFSTQKSIQQPPTEVDDPSTQVVERIDEDDYVEVVIDQNNTYYVTSRQFEEVEAPSDREMRDRLRDAKELNNATRLIIRAHVDSMHSKVVTAWDAGVSAGIEKIYIKTTEEDF
jgi:biopolymer transport protein ExbD